MKTFMDMKRYGFFIIVFFLSAVFEGCKVYKRQPSTVEEASKSNKSVKIIDSNGEVSYYKQLFLEGEEIKLIKDFGLNKGDSVITMSRKNIKEIHVVDDTATTIVTVASTVGVASGIIMIIFFTSGGLDIDISPLH